MGKRSWIVWAPVILLALGAIFLPTDGIPHANRPDAAHSVQAGPSRGPELAFMFAIASGSAPDAQREGSDKTFPLIPVVAGMLVVMAGALHLAAWRLAQ